MQGDMTMKRTSLYLTIVLSFVLFAMLFSGCKSKTGVGNYSEIEDNEDKIKVYTSIYPMFDFAAKIGGDKIELKNLVPAGVEPHDWEPSPRDIAGIESADLFIYNGAGMETWVEKILKTLSNSKLVTVETSREIELLESKDSNDEEHNHHGYDPHVWLNPLFAKKQMEAIKDAFVKADSANRDFYEKNFEINSQKLIELDRDYREAVKAFKRKDVVVTHEAFGYMCDAYGLNQLAIEGIDAHSEPTPARMTEIARYIRDKDVKIIFFEKLSSPKVAQTVADSVGVRVLALNALEGLSEEETKVGKEYFSVMRDNLEALKEALE
jgi:zinc transport system substrate-binding protein